MILKGYALPSAAGVLGFIASLPVLVLVILALAALVSSREGDTFRRRVYLMETFLMLLTGRSRGTTKLPDEMAVDSETGAQSSSAIPSGRSEEALRAKLLDAEAKVKDIEAVLKIYRTALQLAVVQWGASSAESGKLAAAFAGEIEQKIKDMAPDHAELRSSSKARRRRGGRALASERPEGGGSAISAAQP
ncbi:hypothetical protein GCM10009555_104240 [Acrocarpospora macrocephala]|uniref:Uncharacterized protein n=2 Tax=Acrocarpospora macrocephala TaxID=150177 RepID=A0A5M3X3C6_9ACTN|nr:hypothetical protein Amac_062750 [Acrocarpospora macrocephala]